jgi:ubiquinone/menaquinone biosynthesis C-methylase UbiE
MLDRARVRVPGARFVAGDVRCLPLPADSVDVLTTGLALTHVPHLVPVLVELARVLRRGGTAIISDVHPELLYRGSVVKSETTDGEPQMASFHRHSVADHVRAALAAGFTIRRLEELSSVNADTSEPLPDEPTSEPGPWRLWPWSLLDRVPEAARAAWDTPALLVMQVERL